MLRLTAALVLLIVAACPVSEAFAGPAAPAILSGSHYHPRFEGRPTACGGRYQASALTAASARHPCDTKVRVTHGNRSVVVRVTDRCGRCGIDLSLAAARQIGLVEAGRSPVRVEQID